MTSYVTDNRSSQTTQQRGEIYDLRIYDLVIGIFVNVDVIYIEALADNTEAETAA